MSLEKMNNVFKLRVEAHDHLRRTAQFLVDPMHNAFKDRESSSYLDPKI